MIEQLCEKIIAELGATGLLVLGLYFMLYRPLKDMAKHTAVINDELGEVVHILKQATSKIKE